MKSYLEGGPSLTKNVNLSRSRLTAFSLLQHAAQIKNTLLAHTSIHPSYVRNWRVWVHGVCGCGTIQQPTCVTHAAHGTLVTIIMGSIVNSIHILGQSPIIVCTCSLAMLWWYTWWNGTHAWCNAAKCCRCVCVWSMMWVGRHIVRSCRKVESHAHACKYYPFGLFGALVSNFIYIDPSLSSFSLSTINDSIIIDVHNNTGDVKRG